MGTGKLPLPLSCVLSLLDLLQSPLVDTKGRVLLLDGVIAVQVEPVALLVVVHQFSGKPWLHLKKNGHLLFIKYICLLMYKSTTCTCISYLFVSNS